MPCHATLLSPDHPLGKFMSSHGSLMLAVSLSDTPLDAEGIITRLRFHPHVKILNLHHLSLGGRGSEMLFRWFTYGDNDEDCPSLPLLHLADISLSCASLGDMGFRALVKWLERLKLWHQMNMSIPSSTPDGISGLSLLDNDINGSSELALSLVSALSFHKTEPPGVFSSLSYLNLSLNPLSSKFKQTLLSSLPCLPSLRRLHLNMAGLNSTDADAVATYIGKSRLTDFHASANDIGYKGLKKIRKAIKQCWTLESVDLYANDGDMDDDDEEESSHSEEENPGDRHEPSDDRQTRRRLRALVFDRKLKLILSRNSRLKSIVRHQAFELLRCSRLLLLNQRSAQDRSHSELDLLVVQKEAPHHSRCSVHSDNCECLPTFHNPHPNSPVSIDKPQASNMHFPFTRLPMEIQLMVLTQLAPMLSPSQQIRIFERAIDKTTLPDLSLRLPSLDDRGGTGLIRHGNSNIYSRGFLTLRGDYSTGMVYVIEKHKWLDLVGCDAYDPNP